MSITTVPVNITPEAAAHIAALGYEREFEQMLEHTLKTVPRIRHVDVILDHDPEAKDISTIIVRPTLEPEPQGTVDRHGREWDSWIVRTFPPQVFENFLMMSVYGDIDGR